MRTALMTGCFLDGTYPTGYSRLGALKRWKYFYELNDLGQNDIWIFDNGSSPVKHEYWRANCYFFRHDEQLKRGEGLDYPSCWRNLWSIRGLIEFGYKKIIMVDTDAYVISQKMSDYIKNLKSGWVAFHVPKHNFPSAECQILCEDSFPEFLKYTKGKFTDKVGLLMERDIPFTHVEKKFNCDRFGEYEPKVLPDDSVDGYFQANDPGEMPFYA